MPFFALEGGDKVGKTTQWNLLRERFPDFVCFANTKATALGNAVRSVYMHEDLSQNVSLLTAMAVALDECERIVKPALDEGRTVITDRWFHSALIYNRSPEGAWESALSALPFEPIVLLLSERRASLNNDDRFEDEKTAKAIAAAYSRMADALDFVRIGGGDVEHVHARILTAIAQES